VGREIIPGFFVSGFYFSSGMIFLALRFKTCLYFGLSYF
tara:strand:- start:13379 stop:13495 length:117 start_codon:yes stop_codon:yes gene_type:complete